MFTHLAIALDGSPQAEKALPIAVLLAKRLPAPLLLLHVCMEPEDTSNSRQPEPEKAVKPEIYLDQLKKDLTDPSKNWSLQPEFVQTRVQYGKYAYELANVAAAEGANLVIMTTHGRSGLSLLVMGNIATGVLTNTNLPVLLLRPEEVITSLEETFETFAVSFEQKPTRLMVTLDGTPKGEAALEVALALATQLNTTLDLVEVITPTPSYVMFDPGLDYKLLEELEQAQKETLKQEAFQYLEKVQDWIKSKVTELKVETSVLIGLPAAQLVAYIHESKPLLVIMATHARSEVGQILLGSVAEEVLRQSHSPVLMVRIPKGFEGYKLQTRIGEGTS